jgi:hypothetical protein
VDKSLKIKLYIVDKSLKMECYSHQQINLTHVNKRVFGVRIHIESKILPRVVLTAVAALHTGKGVE